MLNDILTEPLKLNLGSRKTSIPGFKNLDIEAREGVDFVADAADLSQFATGSIETINASNIFEHFPHVKNQTVLAEWFRVLKPGGALYISVPDWDACVANYLRSGIFDGWLQNYLYGDQFHKYAFHYTVFNYPYLRRILDEVGFTKVRRLKSLPFGIKDTSELKDTWFGMQMALNAEAIK